MLEKDLRMHALQLATQLPDDETEARRVYAMLGHIMNNWVFIKGQAQDLSTLASSSSILSIAKDSATGNVSALP